MKLPEKQKKTWIHISKGYLCFWKSQSRMVTREPSEQTTRLYLFQKILQAFDLQVQVYNKESKPKWE